LLLTGTGLATQNPDADQLLVEPREALDVELKEWLNLADNDHRAAVAKEIIALANHGGGYLVIGFTDLSDGSFAPATPRPANLNGWSQDAIQSIVAKYIDPAVQCRVEHRSAPGSQDRYPIIAVPGGHRVPIRAKSGSPDNNKLVPHRVYIRRPGPNSEEPKTAEEWDRLLERCLQNRKEELLEAMRSIMAGVVPTAHEKSQPKLDELLQFENVAIARWQARVATLPPDAPAGFLHGYYEVGIAIDGSFEVPSLSELRQTIEREVRNHSGWPPFLTLNRAPFAPKAIDGAVEFWRGPENNAHDVPTRHDFWRVSPQGLFYTRRGYRDDDRVRGKEPGKTLDIVMPTRWIGEAIMQVAYIAQALKATDANLICHCRWCGLAGRQLRSWGNPNRVFFDDQYTSAQDTYEATETVALDALPGSLPELVYTIIAPLYELFDFFKLPKRLVEEELNSLLKDRFS
jgi:hypothetical protein